MVNQIKVHSDLDPIVRFTPTDARSRFQSKAGDVELRISLAPALDRDNVAVRILYSQRLQRSLTDLGLRGRASIFLRTG